LNEPREIQRWIRPEEKIAKKKSSFLKKHPEKRESKEKKKRGLALASQKKAICAKKGFAYELVKGDEAQLKRGGRGNEITFRSRKERRGR